jgi:MoaA/NifB/PqqE/SkfB family radical SAM enzyme
MLRDDFSEIALYAKSKIPFVGVSSSGIGASKNIDALKALDIVFLSLDGPEEIHDYLRGKGSYKVATKAMELMKKEGVPFWFTAVITTKNIEHLDYVLDVAKENNTVANFIPVYATSDKEYSDNLPLVSDIEDIIPTKDQLQGILKKLLEWKRSGKPIGSSSQFYKYILEWPLEKEVYSSSVVGSVGCWAGTLYSAIASDGRMYPCSQWYKDYASAEYNVKENSFSEVFRITNIPKCKSCILSCHLELNIMFSLNPGAIINWKRAIK